MDYNLLFRTPLDTRKRMPDKHLATLPFELIQKLPSYRTATYIPQRFEDSTHELWLIEEIESNEGSTSNNFLKICNNTTSFFWQVMEHLFSFNLPTKINEFNKLYGFINAETPLQIPSLITAESTADTAYILTSELSGSVVSEVDFKMVEQLAQHLAALHQKKHSHWGSLTYLGSQNQFEFKASQWPNKLAQTLIHFSQLWGIPAEITSEALKACQYADASEFVPLMLDLRWDQFLQQDGQLKALIDLDAFVLAPRELDFVLLEYILTTEQHEHFAQVYSETITGPDPIPDIKQVRPAYRLLLFFMQVLGEQNIDTWMTVEHFYHLK